jgi:radical SAM protein with 4Fe4S-binding SPASM domain
MEKNNLVEKPKRIYGQRTDFAEKVLSEELGKRYIEYRKKWVLASKREVVTDFPLYIQIEHTGKCNLRCATCLQGIAQIRENYSKGFTPLKMELYRKILNEAKRYHCPSIAFHNNDEPLLLNDLETRIKMAKQAGFIDLIMTTNATLLTKERTEKLLESGLTKINFSVDGWNEESYKRVRRGGDFKTVLRNIEYFLEQKKKTNLKLPITRATCILTKFTQKKMNKFKRFWQKKVDMVEFQNFQAIKGFTESLKPKGAILDSKFICNGPWQQLVIRANGDVLPCCSFYGTELVVGNIKHDLLYGIWHSSKMEKIRKELLKNNFSFSPICQACAGTFYTL